ncbi:DUF4129 domain-containing protein [Halomicrobium salinisoli]|uniref:DUF4129 domain-containing protein n=1 Tax=Halomicrobium salinisoli TaxID=2878391 RepID=UPI001CF0745A|nr:DUF4129 domain-containing protein [Halomicrobium salinisoli]
MTGSRPLLAVAVVLAVLVVGAAAASLDGTGGDGSGATTDSAAGVGAGNGSGMGSGNGTEVALNFGGSDPALSSPFDGFVERFMSLVMALAVVGPAVYAAVVIWQEGFRSLLTALRGALTDTAALVVVIALFLLVVYALSLLAGNGGGGMMGTGSDTGGLDAASGDVDRLSPVDVPLPLVVVGLLLAVAFLGASLTGRSGSDRSPPSTASVRSRSPDADGGVDRESRVATSLEDAAAGNDVYRAWLGLAEAAGATDRAATPTEVAHAARERGLDERAVAELTALFREVRYAGRDVTSDREHRARDALERVREAE